MKRAILLPLFAACCIRATAAIPAPESLLPDDTLAVITAPDFAKLKALYNQSAQGQLWNDPAMKAFRDKFANRWFEQIVKPLERELNVNIDEYSQLLQGQITIALLRNGWEGDADQPLGFLLLLDSREQRADLKKKLGELRKKWFDSGKNLRLEKVRDTEFTVLQISSNDVPKTLQRFFPRQLEVQELGSEPKPHKGAPPTELLAGQFESLLIVANSVKVAEKVVARLSGGSAPCLAEQSGYQASHLRFFRDAPVYGWVNTKTIIGVLGRKAPEKRSDESPNPLDAIDFDKIIDASGLRGLASMGFSMQNLSDGMLLQMFLGVPESARRGLFRILAGEPKETNPPPFVPADAVKFQRWRLDGQKAWATIEKMMGDISPQWIGAVNFLLNTATEAGKAKDPGFDIRKNLIGNLGDDVISFEKAPRGSSPTELSSAPSILLLGSPNAEQLTAALKSILVFMSPQADAPPEREFLGRKIYSIPLPSIPLPTGESSPSGGSRTLHYAATTGYVAMSTDSAMLEEYLRSAESKAKALRETANLPEALQHVTDPGCSLFGYRNHAESMRVEFEAMKKNPAMGTNIASLNLGWIPGMPVVGSAEKSLQDCMDFSLLPEFEKLSKYFHFSVYGGSANVDGLYLKVFYPTPPLLRK
jgi:hypothetical protein